MFATVRINTPLESIEPYQERGDEEAAGPLAPSLRTATCAFRRSEFLSCRSGPWSIPAREVVYVEREPGIFEGVEVELGPRQGESIRSSRASTRATRWQPRAAS